MSAAQTPVVFEEHCTVLATWQRLGLRGKTLVYADAHLDLQYVNAERMARLRSAGSSEAFAALEKPDHLLPDGDYVYGLENFLYPASELGIIDHLIWIAPPHVEVGQSERVLGYAQQMDGVSFDELVAFRQAPGGWYEGRLLGLAVTVCTLDQLPALPIPAGSLVDVDTDFFVALPADRVWIDPAAVFRVLEREVEAPALVSIARSVGSGFMPLRYRYFADYLSALWRKDDKAASHYARLFGWDQRLTAENGAEYGPALEAELAAFPDCPATWYLCSQGLPEPGSYVARAASLCDAYRTDLARVANETANRHLETPIEALDDIERQIEGRGEAAATRELVALGLAYAERGAVSRALECYRKLDADHPALALAMATRLASSADRATRRELLEVATREDASTTSAHLQLGELDIRTGDFASARRHLEQAHANAPAWMEPLQGLGWLHAQMGGAEPNPYAAELSRRATALEELVRNAR